MAKFIRTYNIKILTPEGDLIEIAPPFSGKFSIVRNTLASANKCSLEIKGLGFSTRSKLFKDRYTITEYWQIIITAGYDQISTVFQGNILESFHYKQGSDWITKIEAFDGLFGIQNGFSSFSVTKDTEKKNIVEQILSNIPNVLKGALGSPTEGQSPRGQVVMGQSTDMLDIQTDGQYFIDNEIINIVSNEEYIGDNILELDSNILFSSPRRRETFIDCETLFFAEAEIGLLVNLNSLIPEYNGQYKLMGFRHEADIARDKAGKARSILNLYAGAGALRKAV